MVVLDTNIVIDALHGNNAVIDEINTYVGDGKLSITVINKYELLRGLSTLQDEERARLHEFLSSLVIHALGEKEISYSTEIYWKLKELGKLINELDIIIAGISLSNGERLLTNDQDFRFIKSSSPNWDSQIILLK
jgi:tRNA(fMet)-specific endonuclease VapC